MSEMKHTPEPWVESHTLVFGDDTLVARCANENTANAQRIVDCVNACAGMNDPATEIATLRARVAELEKATEPTTVREWLEQLPDGYRERALEQCDCLDERCTSMSMALIIFSVWEDTQEKFRFWNAVDEHYTEGTPLPPLPEQI